MNLKLKNIIKDLLISLLILSVFFFISLVLDSTLNSKALIPAVFVLAVFAVSVFTSGYFYGNLSVLISVLAVNYAFTFPYFSFNFKIYENIISAIILFCVTTATSALTIQIKRQEKARLAAEKEKMRADLLRAVSHDLRTPLTGIFGATSTLFENFDILPDNKKLEILSGIKNDSQWLVRMVENLLSITRLDDNAVKIIKSSVVLEELIDTVLSKFKKSNSGTRVIVNIPEEFTVISADALLIVQVLLNLLENAVFHAKGMTKLMLNVYIKDSKAIFEVLDDGCGIEKEKLKNIFTGYYMAENDALCDNSKKCMGIGLSVCAAIIRAHGGNIRGENVKGGGMRFWFELEIEEGQYE